MWSCIYQARKIPMVYYSQLNTGSPQSRVEFDRRFDSSDCHVVWLFTIFSAACPPFPYLPLDTRTPQMKLPQLPFQLASSWGLMRWGPGRRASGGGEAPSRHQQQRVSLGLRSPSPVVAPASCRACLWALSGSPQLVLPSSTPVEQLLT